MPATHGGASPRLTVGGRSLLAPDLVAEVGTASFLDEISAAVRAEDWLLVADALDTISPDDPEIEARARELASTIRSAAVAAQDATALGRTADSSE